MSKPKPKNGQHFLALIVGGVPVHAKLRPLLAERGIIVGDVWTAQQNIERKFIPPLVDVAILFKDNDISRDARDKLAYKAKTAGALVIEASLAEGQTAAIAAIEKQLDAKAYKGKPVDQDVARESAPPPPAPPLRVPLPPLPPVKVTLTPEEQRRAAGALFRARREEYGLTAIDAAKRIGGVTNSTLGAIELGVTNPAAELVERVELFLGLPVGTYPRLATRANHRVGKLPPVVPFMKPPAPPPPPAHDVPSPDVIIPPSVIDAPPSAPVEPAAPEPEPTVVAAPLPPVVVEWRQAAPALGEEAQLLVELAAIKSRMSALGIVSIEITPRYLIVRNKEPA